MTKFVVEIKTNDGKIWFLESRGRGLADWTPDQNKAKKFNSVESAITAHNKTAKFAVCRNSGVTQL